MKITTSSVQFNPKIGDVQSNLTKITVLVKKSANAGAKLILLPEICDIGYDLEIIKKTAESFPNASTKKLSEVAKQNDVIIIAGLAERRTEGIFNTAVVFDSDGKIIAKYYKTHLCPIPPLNEPAVFKPGSSLLLTEIGGIKLGVTICYDIRFPEIYRKLASSGAQIIAVPAAFPKMRIDQLEICARARAIENQLFVMTVNFCGISGQIELGGRSMIIGTGGELLAKAGDDEECVITATVDLDDIEKIRKECPVFTQRRPELYKI